MLGVIKQIAYIVLKDVWSEYRTKYAFNVLLLFTLVSVLMTVLVMGKFSTNKEILAGLFWIIIFFSSMGGLSRSFVSEFEKGTHLTLRLIAHPLSIYIGKLCVNVLLLFVVSIFIILLYIVFFPMIGFPSLFAVLLLLVTGNAGIAVTTTFLAALLAKTEARESLYTVLAVPPLLPVYLTVVQATIKLVLGESLHNIANELWIVVGYIITMCGVSILLFDKLWND
ncbi:MAG: heme exporter protein CcmB [Bacteroidetes bacterium]|nr:heme exporter protein CcmB [Bacteroidota bacterium]